MNTNDLIPLHCHVCGSETLDRRHGKSTGEGLAVASVDESAVTVHPDRDEYDNPHFRLRGGYVKIDYVCPSGHDTALVIANHKGTEYAGWVVE